MSDKRRVEIINLTTYRDEVAVYLVYCKLSGERTNLFNELGIEIKHRRNSKIYRVIEKENAAITQRKE